MKKCNSVTNQRITDRPAGGKKITKESEANTERGGEREREGERERGGRKNTQGLVF